MKQNKFFSSVSLSQVFGQICDGGIILRVNSGFSQMTFRFHMLTICFFLLEEMLWLLLKRDTELASPVTNRSPGAVNGENVI